MNRNRKILYGGKKSVSKSLTLRPYQLRIFEDLKKEYNFPSNSALFQFMIGFMDSVLKDESSIKDKKNILELMRVK